MDGKTQGDAVSVLRNTKLGSTVSLVVSRQEVEDERFKVPRQLVSGWDTAEYFFYVRFTNNIFNNIRIKQYKLLNPHAK